MPVRWTPQNDQLLLLKILETHKLSVDTKKVAESWPKNNPEGVPTPRAIEQRLIKIRNESKAEFSIAKGKNTGSTETTPRKGSKTTTPKTPTSKRKRDHEANGDHVDSIDTPSTKRTNVKAEVQKESDVLLDAEAFTPRMKREIPVPTPRLGLIPFYGFEGEAEAPEVETSGSEYAPVDDDIFADQNMA
ncbi:hypothetical protein FQN54_007743 [Arachnomyces sp. PD_36]|nr:hypothetical protein FQN54_007743 [Arachnomyces sp. PD_36]